MENRTEHRGYGMASSQGGREYNEDSCAVRDYSRRRLRRYLCFMAVADGMGGHRAGDVASQVAIQMLQNEMDPENFESPDDFRTRAEEVLWKSFSSVNSHIYDLGQTSSDRSGMGTTLTCAVIDEESAYIAHVGDTRAYLVSPQASRQITEDHSIVGRMVSDGLISEEQARKHEQRNVITRAIGPEANVEIDILRVPMRPGETLFMCTDGLHTKVSREEIARVILPASDLQAACEHLVELAVARGTDDNATCTAWRMPYTGEQAAVGRPHTRAGTKKRKMPRWAVALVVIAVLAVGFSGGWFTGSIWYSGKKGVKRVPPGSEHRTVKGRFSRGDKVLVSGDDCRLLKYPDGDVTGDVTSTLRDGWELEIVYGPTRKASGDWYEVEVSDTRYASPIKRGYVLDSCLKAKQQTGGN